MELRQNIFKPGDWVHTQDGVGLVMMVFPQYYQYWEKLADDKYRAETYDTNTVLADSMLGKPKNVGDWVMDILHVKRLCNHDLIPCSRISCFHTRAYANDSINKREMAKVNKVLKDSKIASRFENHECKYPRYVHSWEILISPNLATNIKRALCTLENNSAGALKWSMSDVEAWLRQAYGFDILGQKNTKVLNNVVIKLTSLPVNDKDHYNHARERIFCKLEIARKTYVEEDLSKLIDVQHLDRRFYEESAWENAGWDDA